MLRALDLALTMRADKDIKAGGLPLEDGDVVAQLHIPIPKIEDGAARSAAALGLGGFSAEFLRKHPDLFAQFTNWLNGTYPSSRGQDVTTDDMELADQLLTLMSAVIDKVADDGGERPDTVTIPAEAEALRHI
jgi:hypothetical protein